MSRRADPRAKRETPKPPADGRKFAKTLVQVLGVQVITLVLLWLFQFHFTH